MLGARDVPTTARDLDRPDGPRGSHRLGVALGRTGVSTLRWVLDAVDD